SSTVTLAVSYKRESALEFLSVRFDGEWLSLPEEQMSDAGEPVSEFARAPLDTFVHSARNRRVLPDTCHHQEITGRGDGGTGRYGDSRPLALSPRLPFPLRESQRYSLDLTGRDHVSKLRDI